MDNNHDYSMQDVMRLAASPAGQQLMKLLQQQSPSDLQNAMNSAAAGDYRKAKDSLSSLFASAEAQQLLKQLGGGNG
ncbi:MAG: hypothetical protein IKJ99_01495 [Oscillospiraceae bacterium]|nr:hypothetical protein [Oscillospiraceae bacterium]